MTFPLNAYVIALLSAWTVSAAAVPLWRKWCLRFGVVDEPGPRKIHAQPIPLAGGLSIITGILLPTLVAALLLLWRRAHPADPAIPGLTFDELEKSGPSLSSPPLFLLYHGLHRRMIELVAIFVGAVGMLLIGFIDDKRELRPLLKFSGQCLIALFTAAMGVRITLFVPSLLFSYAITVLWILTVVNAFNFIDNMNGLCGGLGAIAAFYFALYAAAYQQYLVTLLALLAFGALLGFLPWNFPSAKVFLGDAGSHLVGYLMAVLAVLPHYYTPHHRRALAVLSPLLVLAVPLTDLVWVVAYRVFHGKPFYVGDTNHLSHQLVRRGVAPVRAVLALALAAAVLGAAIFAL